MKNPRNPYGGVEPQWDHEVHLNEEGEWLWRNIRDGGDEDAWCPFPSEDPALPAIEKLAVGESIIIYEKHSENGDMGHSRFRRVE